MLARDVSAQGVAVLWPDQLHEADRLETALAADDRAEVAEDLQALEGQARFRLVGVVHAHEGARFAGGARAQVAALDEQDIAHTERGQMEGRARAVDASTDDDDVGRAHDDADCSTPRALDSRTRVPANSSTLPGGVS